MLKQRAAPWGKRIQLLHRIQTIVKTHKKARKQLEEKYNKEESKEEKEKLGSQLKFFGKYDDITEYRKQQQYIKLSSQ